MLRGFAPENDSMNKTIVLGLLALVALAPFATASYACKTVTVSSSIYTTQCVTTDPLADQYILYGGGQTPGFYHDFVDNPLYGLP